ncbi:MAG: hypothetical protein ACLP9S_00790 [Syntrophales bacterium]|jgi:hypothetical protein
MKALALYKRCFLILMTAFFIISCSRLPVIKPVDTSMAPDTMRRCHLPFLDIPYQFIHTIEVVLPDGRTGTVVGVTAFDPATKTIQSVIMTIEGFVLFDAIDEKEVRVNRAVPPFNAEYFAGYMMDDVRLIFLTPDGRLSDIGVFEDGSTVCRYYVKQNWVTDVIVHTDNTWEIKRYSDSNELLRKVMTFSLQDRIPGIVELNAFGFREYTLRLNLINAEPFSPETLRLRPDGTAEDDE